MDTNNVDQLSGMDSAFLAAESRRTPMHVTAVLLYEPPVQADVETVQESVGRRFQRIIALFPALRRNVRKAPMQFDHPYWVDDQNFDVDRHLSHVVLPRPGDRSALDTEIGAAHLRGLDLQRPLWEAVLIEGLDNVDGLPPGAFAIVLKVHHAAMDGMTMARVIAELNSEPHEGAPAEWQPREAPSQGHLWWNSYRNYVQRPTQLWKTLRQLAPAMRDARSDSEEKRKLLQKFRTRFNGSVTEKRVFGDIEFDIAALSTARKLVAGATLNDVVLSIVGGALRRYLAELDELPDEPLVAGAPVNIRGKERDQDTGNLLSMMRIPLYSDLEDPVERLTAVHADSSQAKAYVRDVGSDMIGNLTQHVDPQLLTLGVRAIGHEMLNELVAAPVHTMVSSVPGPREDVFLGNARLNRILGLGPLIDQVGLFHAVTSLGGRMTVTFASCPEMLAEPDRYRQCLLDAYEELIAAS